MNIRRATAQDVKVVASLCHHVQEVHIQGRPDIFKPFDDEVLTEHMRLRLEAPDTIGFLGEADHQAVAYVMLAVIDKPASLYKHPEKYMEIDQISVHPDYQRRGYGELLTQYAMEFAKSIGISHVTLGVWAFNTNAIRFYERLGFTNQHTKMEIIL
ncbi:MAG: GNAT family N-acetyltransferase [Aggregatilineales bacterium]